MKSLRAMVAQCAGAGTLFQHIDRKLFGGRPSGILGRRLACSTAVQLQQAFVRAIILSRNMEANT